MKSKSENILDKVFGIGSSGETLEDRALLSQREFVRGQTMLAEASPEAKGHRLTAAEALYSFGFETLRTAVEEGQALIVSGRDEPAQTLRKYREALGYSRDHLAHLAKLSIDDVIKAETPGKMSPISKIERMARILAIDERILGFKQQSNVEELGVRLRQLANSDGNNRLSPNSVAALAEGAWIIARQKSLLSQLGVGSSNILKAFVSDDDYGHPAYERGYQLAAKARELIGLGPVAPITSVRNLVSDILDIPLVQTKLGSGLAGATIENGTDRGIVVNIEGANKNVWVRRMTLAHELGHLLWDPRNRLNRLMVDRYNDLVVNSSTRRDPVEIRANAFAIAFLAPPSEVDRIVHTASDIPTAVFEVAQHFGVSVSAAAAHVGNVSRVRVSLPGSMQRPEPSQENRAQEDFTIDFFPIKGVPAAVVGRFAKVVSYALVKKIISADTAATLLQTDSVNLSEEVIKRIIDLI